MMRELKPHIYLSAGNWVARVPSVGRKHAFYGFGSTPRMAWLHLRSTLAIVTYA